MTEDLALEALTDFLDGVESGIVAARQRIKDALVETPQYDVAKIRWEPAQGSSGPYEKSSDIDNLDFKNLLKDVQGHGGKMTVKDYFVWAFQNGDILGRKKRK